MYLEARTLHMLSQGALQLTPVFDLPVSGGFLYSLLLLVQMTVSFKIEAVILS